ncbi:DUF814 domain-containing protein [bacterium]|nr:DUF814 domain-containing protein [bacterium]
MYLSDTIQVVDFLNKFAVNSLVSAISASRGGTLVRLYGNSEISGFFFHLKEKIIIPVRNLSAFPKEPLTRLEEGLRANFYGKIKSFSVMKEFGKVVKVETENIDLIIPLFAGKPVRISDKSGNSIWMERKDNKLNLLEKQMKDFPLTFENPLFWESWFIEKSDREGEEEKRKKLEEKRNKILSSINIVKEDIGKHEENLAKFSEFAELLRANLWKFDSSEHKNAVILTDYENNEKEITLDPAKTVLQNMERFFANIKKAKSGIENSGKRLESLNEELKKLNDVSVLTEEAKSVFKQKKKQTGHVPYHEFHAANGRVFLVGKEAADNDELTFKIALPHDLWFHAKDYHGSHVIMRMKKGEEPKHEDILTACRLAILYSRAKKGGCGEVWFTARKNVTKRKGMAAGLVNFKNAKVIYMKDVAMPEGLVKV